MYIYIYICIYTTRSLHPLGFAFQMLGKSSPHFLPNGDLNGDFTMVESKKSPKKNKSKSIFPKRQHAQKHGDACRRLLTQKIWADQIGGRFLFRELLGNHQANG